MKSKVAKPFLFLKRTSQVEDFCALASHPKADNSQNRKPSALFASPVIKAFISNGSVERPDEGLDLSVKLRSGPIRFLHCQRASGGKPHCLTN